MGLSDFEKELEKSKSSREKHKKKHRSHSRDRDRDRHRHSSNRHRTSHQDHDSHRSRRDDNRKPSPKRRRNSSDDEDDEEDFSKSRSKRRRDLISDNSSDDDEVIQEHGVAPPPDDDTLDNLLEQAINKDTQRDSWMRGPSGLEDVQYVSRKDKQKEDKSKYVKASTIGGKEKQDYETRVHEHEARSQLEDARIEEEEEEVAAEPKEESFKEVDYTFGDSGSSWRMTRLKGVYRQSEESGRPVEDVALDIYGDLKEFDVAREEEVEIDRRKRYGSGYRGKDKPTGELYQERMKHIKPLEPKFSSHSISKISTTVSDPQTGSGMDQTQLNKLKAKLMKAKLKGGPEVTALEAEYNRALASSSSKSSDVVVLNAMDNRLLAFGRGNEVTAAQGKAARERGAVEENQDMSLEDMVRQERRNKAGYARNEGFLLADRITKDAKFSEGLDYLDENAERLAKRAQKTDINLRSIAIDDFQKMQRILETCPLCHHDENEKQKNPIAPMLARGTRTFLTLPTEPEICPDGGGAVIVPVEHHDNLLHCDDDEWEEIRNFMKCLTRMYHDQGRDVIFYENAARPGRHQHAALHAVPVPHSVGATAPAFFREAILAADEEWAQHKKVIDTLRNAREGGMGRNAFRKSLAKEMPYFHAWFELDGGLGHVVEDENRWPSGDLFAREVLGGMMDVDGHTIRKQGRWHRGEDPRVKGFSKRWRKFDWTRVLAE